MDIVRSQSANAAQLSILTSFMENNHGLAKSYNSQSAQGRQEATHLWEQLKLQLNAEGPPTKTVAEWKRVRLFFSIFICKL